jgi:tetratricopeptide (TPR) repeat protein
MNPALHWEFHPHFEGSTARKLLNIAFPVKIGCISLDHSPASKTLTEILSDLEASGKVKAGVLESAFDDAINSQLKYDILIVGQAEYSERIFSFASHLRSIPNQAFRPILIVCESEKATDHQSRAKALGLEFFTDPAGLINCLDELCARFKASDALIHTLTLQRLFDNKNLPELMKKLATIGDNLPESGYARALEAAVWLSEENTNKAEQLLRRGVTELPESMPMRHLLARVLARQGKFSEAQMFLEQHPQYPFQETLNLLGLARIALESSDHLRAEQYFKSVHLRDTSNPEAELGLGKIAFARGLLDEASEHFVRAGHCDELASYFNQMAIALVNQKRYKDALFIYQNALKVLPSRDKHHFIHYNIGLAQKKRGALLEAAESFATSLRLSPSYEKALLGLRDVVSLMGPAEVHQSSVEQYKKLLAERGKEN